MEGGGERRDQPGVRLQPLLGQQRKKEREDGWIRLFVIVQQVLREAERQSLLGANRVGAGQVVPGVDAAWSRADKDAQPEVERQSYQTERAEHERHGLHLSLENGISHSSQSP